MTPAIAESITEILIVAIGGAITLLLAGALLYWIDREWRSLDAQHRQQHDAAIRREKRGAPDKSSADRSSGS